MAIYASMDSFSATNAIRSGSDVRKKESFETLNEAAGIKYSIGAMAPVDDKSIATSLNEGNRVANSLIKSLKLQGESVASRLQGSVALDIHIKGHSDLDMLIVVENPVNIETPKIEPNWYSTSTDPRNLIDIVRDVRRKSELILPINFPKAKVVCSGSKSIDISGASLTRKVDIVPAIWYDSIKYQMSKNEHDRGI